MKKRCFAFLICFAVVIGLSAAYFLRPDSSQARNSPETKAVVLVKEGSFVYVNEEKITSDAPVSTGSIIQTSKSAGVEVTIGSIGDLLLEKKSKASLQYYGREANVILEEGCAILWLEAGMSGGIKTGGRQKYNRCCRLRTSIEACADRGAGGILLWSAAIAGGGTGIVLLDQGEETASASRLADLR